MLLIVACALTASFVCAAVQVFDGVGEWHTGDAETYFQRGNAYFDQQQYERAIQEYTKAIQLKPDYVEAYNNRGMCYQELGDTAKAQAYFARTKQLGYNG